jgi:hypothetical protein
VAIDGESCVLALLYRNITFYSISVRPFFILDGEVNYGVDSGVDSEGDVIDMIIIDTSEGKDIDAPALILKRKRGRPCKNPNITIFL